MSICDLANFNSSNLTFQSIYFQTRSHFEFYRSPQTKSAHPAHNLGTASAYFSESHITTSLSSMARMKRDQVSSTTNRTSLPDRDDELSGPSPPSPSTILTFWPQRCLIGLNDSLYPDFK